MSKLNVLVAWPYYDQTIGKRLASYGGETRLLLDSGAFTAWKAGKTLALADYCRFIDSLPVKPWRHFMLDVIGNPEATRKNYEESLRLGYNPIPIFTRGEDVGLLEFYYGSSDLVAIGGLVGTRHNKGFVNGIMRHVGKRPVHWLGFTQHDFMTHYRPYSADSTSWARPMRFGQLDVYLGKGRWVKTNRAKVMKAKPSAAVIEGVRRLGLSPVLLSEPKEWVNSGAGRNMIEVAAFRSWALYQHEIEETLGVRLFLACGTDWQLRLAMDGRQHWIDRGVIPANSERTAA